uniref:Uncharacterized protein n=1 Tax=Hyaloperonospora arabidopsidis (strain Emoy2) TaxID=559515 RepID=M4C0V1_HYAAE
MTSVHGLSSNATKRGPKAADTLPFLNFQRRFRAGTVGHPYEANITTNGRVLMKFKATHVLVGDTVGATDPINSRTVRWAYDIKKILHHEKNLPSENTCNGVTQMVIITRYIGVVHTERDQYH